MTSVGIESEAMVDTTHIVKKRGPYKPRVAREDRPVNFDHMDIKRLEGLVGRTAIGVEVRGHWVVVDFGNCTISFRQWKSA